jgi:hypothetical protein
MLHEMQLTLSLRFGKMMHRVSTRNFNNSAFYNLFNVNAGLASSQPDLFILFDISPPCPTQFGMAKDYILAARDPVSAALHELAAVALCRPFTG